MCVYVYLSDKLLRDCLAKMTSTYNERKAADGGIGGGNREVEIRSAQIMRAQRAAAIKANREQMMELLERTLLQVIVPVFID
jgi:hypothetical protein